MTASTGHYPGLALGEPSSTEAAGGAAASKPYPWILSPVIDLLFVTGFGAVALVVCTYLMGGWQMPADLASPGSATLLAFLYLGQHVFSNAHTAATYTRLWGNEEDRQRFRFHRVVLPLLLAPIFFWGLFSETATSWIVYIYLIVVFWHYGAQAFGIALIYCYKRGYRLSKWEKWVFKYGMLSLSAFVIIRLLALEIYKGRGWFGVPIPDWGALPMPMLYVSGAVLVAFVIASGFIIVRKAIVDRQLVPAPALMIVATVAWIGLSTGEASLVLWYWGPAFFHGSQYLAVTLAYNLKERGLPEGMNTWHIAREAFGPEGRKFLIWVTMTGSFLYIGVPFFLNQLGFHLGMVTMLVASVLNYHHFLTDMAIWRLRDPRCREILLA